MQLPVAPPAFDTLLNATIAQSPALLTRLMRGVSEVDEQGRYLHWDKLRHLPAPDGLTSEQWWLGIKLARRKNFKPLPLHDRIGAAFQYSLPANVHKELHFLDRYASGAIQAELVIADPQTRDTYLIRSLIEEAISSSQLEGASTTQNVAKEMIRQAREPRDRSERMILNNYQAMRRIREFRDEPLTPSLVFELQRILSEGTLDSDDQAGRLRRADEPIQVVDNVSHVVLHVPPAAEQLPARLQALCDFANADATHEKDANTFLHPVVKAIALHFMLGYDHPFCDGNGRTARALFYWAMAREGYWLAEFISISTIIKASPAQYGKAYLHSETDDNDLTYFLIHQLEVIHKAVTALHAFLRRKVQEINDAEQMLTRNARLKGRLNFRQLALLRHALKHPRFAYVIDEHQNSHGISYDVARKDLLFMADELKLLTKTKEGKRYLFVVPEDIEQRIRK
ncbi:MAG: Fic family protein [Xanthomonadaceae bacterium]|nr:Fic family protein [Xanthomonadaceae bacterium]MDP2184522.1 Fic family protein [Xanthomonadales bacterium]MDZ4115358.1 Fic family protein [Xanthomonadaceae bacterium]MDZ4376945.1 Fic family protein [Xanthomonadaceae bacterium]